MMFVDVSLRMRVEKLEARLAELESRFTAPEPQPACKLAHDWMLEHLKDIASEIELDRDSEWLDSDLIDDKCLSDYDLELLREGIKEDKLSRGEP